MGRDEFMDLTPRFFDGLVRQHREMREREERGRDFMLSQLIAMVANTGFARYKEVRKPNEFLPHWQRTERSGKRGRERKPRMTKGKHAALAAEMRATFMHFVVK
jgi:hypothetical protein